MHTYCTEYYSPTSPPPSFLWGVQNQNKSYNYNHTYTIANSSVTLTYGHVGSSSNLETGFVWRVDFLCTGCGSSLNSCVVPGGREARPYLQRKRHL